MTLSTMLALLFEGYKTTMVLFTITLVLGVPLGIPFALGRLSKFKPLAWLFQLIISLLRGTPLMLQMFAVAFLPYFAFGIVTGPGFIFTATCIAFVINYAAYFAEIYRSGIQSIPAGQYEAASVLGYSSAQTFFRIVLPQVVKRILPAMGNEVVTLVKDTSLAFSLGVIELFSQSRSIVNSQRTMVGFALAALIYWLTCLVIEFAMSRLEKKLDYYHD